MGYVSFREGNRILETPRSFLPKWPDALCFCVFVVIFPQTFWKAVLQVCLFEISWRTGEIQISSRCKGSEWWVSRQQRNCGSWIAGWRRPWLKHFNLRMIISAGEVWIKLSFSGRVVNVPMDVLIKCLSYNCYISGCKHPSYLPNFLHDFTIFQHCTSWPKAILSTPHEVFE